MRLRLGHTFSSTFFFVSAILLTCATVAQSVALGAQRFKIDAGKRGVSNVEARRASIEDVAGWFRETVHSKSKREREESEITQGNEDIALGWFRAAKLSERKTKRTDWLRFSVHPLSERDTVKGDLAGQGDAGTGLDRGWFRSGELSERDVETELNPPDDHAWFVSADLSGSEGDCSASR